MAIRNMDAFVAACSSATRINFYKTSSSTNGAGATKSLWLVSGVPGVANTPASGSGEACSSTTPGALPLPSIGSGVVGYLSRLSAYCSSAGDLVLYDRLVQTYGQVTSTTSYQSINTVALPRYTNSPGTEIWVECYTAYNHVVGNTITATYTNSLGVGGRTTRPVTLAPNSVAGYMVKLPLATGDVGVNSVQGIQMSTSMSSGVIGVTILKRIIDVPLGTSTSQATAVTLSFTDTAMPIILPDACLTFMQVGTFTTPTGVIFGSADIILG